MTRQAHASGEQPERLRLKVYRELGRAGWSVPQSDREVRAAEVWIARHPVRLPDRLREVPELGQSRESGGLLERYLRDDERPSSMGKPKSRDEGQTNRDLER